MDADALPLTEAQRRLVERLTQVLQADAQVLGAWVAGSLGKGAGDRYSDVDVLVLAAGDPSELAARYHRDADAITPTVLALLHLGRVVSCVTPGWDRFDLTFIDARELQRYDGRALASMFSRGPQPGEPAARPAPPSAFAANLTEFFRVLGLAPVGVGRRECVVMLEGIGHLRRILVDAMLEQNGVTPSERGGVLKLNPFLTEAQRAALAALPPLAMSVESLLEGSLAIARIYVPLAKSMADARGLRWPDALEAAARRHIDGMEDVAMGPLW